MFSVIFILLSVDQSSILQFYKELNYPDSEGLLKASPEKEGKTETTILFISKNVLYHLGDESRHYRQI